MRRKAEEIVTLYDLEPATRKDIYVEGSTDKDFLDWALRQAGVQGRSVFAIESIEVPNEAVEAAGLTLGSNRNRVMALATMVWAEIAQETCTLQFAVDKDLTAFIRSQTPINGILSTDYPSMDAYLATEASIDRYLNFVCGVKADALSAQREAIYSLSQFLFAARVAKERLGLCIALLPVSGNVSLTKGLLAIDKGTFIHRTLNRAAMMNQLETMTAAVDEVLHEIEAQSSEPISFCHGHDLLAILGEAAQLLARDSAYRKEGRVRSALLMAVNFQRLREHALLSRLLQA